MAEISEQAGSISLAEARRLALERLRFEASMGLEVVPRVALARAVPVMPAAVVQAIPANAGTATAQERPFAERKATLAPTVAPQTAAAVSNLSKDERWKTLEARAMGCVSCALHSTRTKVVFGTGNREAKLVFVGEGPGQDEDLQGEPFVGRAGQLLNKIIGAMGLKREDVYICNVVKCRPPGNRTPLPDEVSACLAFLSEQIALIEPKVIVALGGPAAKTLLRTDTGITALRGRWAWHKNIPVMPTFHPAFVLRQYTEETRRAVWEDMKKVMEKLKSSDE